MAHDSSETILPPQDIAPFIVLTPVFEDTDACAQLFRDLATEFPGAVQIVAVDDGAVARPLTAQDIAKAGLPGVVLRLKRNVGHQRAIAIGLGYIAEHLPTTPVVIMDSDGEDPPNAIGELLRPLASQNVDVVVAERGARVEGLGFRLFYLLYRALFRLLTGRAISFGNFMALSASGARRLSAMQETWLHVAGAVLTSKLRLINCPLDRARRYAGHSKMNFVGLVLHGFRAIMVFTEDVLVRVGIACAIVASVALLAMPVPLILKTIDMATPGWSSVLLSLFFLIFIQTGTLTLIALLLTGLTRGGGISPLGYENFILQVLVTDQAVIPTRPTEAP